MSTDLSKVFSPKWGDGNRKGHRLSMKLSMSPWAGTSDELSRLLIEPSKIWVYRASFRQQGK